MTDKMHFHFIVLFFRYICLFIEKIFFLVESGGEILTHEETNWESKNKDRMRKA